MAENKTATTQVDLTCVKPYGDALNDGKVQLAFTLPVPYGEEAEECGETIRKKIRIGRTKCSIPLRAYKRIYIF